MKTFVILVVVIAAVWVFLKHNTYVSSPGFVSAEYFQQFEKTKKTCYGYSVLLNASAMAADAPGESMCIGLIQ